MKRTLNLKRETLTELTPADLVSVVGAANTVTLQGATCPLTRCLNLSDLLGCLPTADGCGTASSNCR